MKHRRLESATLVIVGLAAMFVLLVGVNVLMSRAKWRADLTEEKAFTLSDGTRQILAGLKSPVQMRFYCTRGDEAMPMGLKNYAQNVDDLLDAMVAASDGKLTVQRLDPKPDSDAEESARLDGVEPQVLPNGDRVYLGLGFSQLDRKTALPFLSPERERLLEYDIARAIKTVSNARKPVIGLLTPLPTSSPPPMMQMVERPPSPGVFFDELRRAFDVKEIPFGTAEISSDIETLVVVHPREISEVTQYAIDQFVLRGGKLVAFLDPMCVMDLPPMGAISGAPPSASTLSKLLPAWGVKFDTSEVVVDMQNVGGTRRGRAPGVLSLGPDSLDAGAVVTGGVDSLFMAMAGSYGGEGTDGVSCTPLVVSSDQSQLLNPGFVQSSPQAVEANFKPSGTAYNLAIKLEGKFKTAFPQGKPKDTQQGEAPLPDAAQSPDTSAPPGLKESAGPSVIYLVGDADMLFDPLAVAEMPTPFGRPVLVPANGNIDFAQSMVEQLAGGDELASVRSRASRDRPFTVVKRMQAVAEGKFRDKIAELEKSLNETQARLTDLERGKEAGQQFILSPEQQAEIKTFREKEVAAKKELKELRKTLRVEVEALEQRIKWVNILAMPLVVAVAGLLIALVRHRRQRAR